MNPDPKEIRVQFHTKVLMDGDFKPGSYEKCYKQTPVIYSLLKL